MAISRSVKEAQKADLAQNFLKSNAAVVAECAGIGVSSLSTLRVKLREVDAEFKVIKNRVAKKAIEQDVKDALPLVDSLKGPVGVVFMYGDAGAATKSLLEFHKSEPDKFKICAGVMDGKLVEEGELKAIAELPSKEVLMGQLVGMMLAPHQNLMRMISAVPEKMVRAISAMGDKEKS